jgi:hypothetical protein
MRFFIYLFSGYLIFVRGPLFQFEQTANPDSDTVMAIKSTTSIDATDKFLQGLAGTAEKFSVRGDGLVTGSGLAGTWQTISYASSITPDLSNGCFIRVGQLTGNITVQNPTHTSNGMIMLIKFNNNSQGAKTITWGSEFTNVPYTSISQSKQAIVMFIRVDTGAWNQVGTVQEFN